MAKRGMARGLLGGLLLLAASCSNDDASDGATRNASLSPAPAASRAKPSGGKAAASAPPATRATRPERGAVVAAPAAELPAVVARPLFDRLPRATLAALRLPQLDRLGEAASRTALAKLLDAPELAALRGTVQQGFDQAFAEVAAKAPELVTLFAELKGSAAELVVAWLSVDPLAFTGNGVTERLPIRAALLLDGGLAATRIDSLLEALVERAAANSPRGSEWELVERAARGWHRRLRSDGIQVDLERDGTQFVLLLGADDGRDERPLPPLTPSDSFSACELVRATAPPRAGATTIAEAFVQLDPVWQLCQRVASPAVNTTLALGGFTSIRGVAASCALAEEGIDECVRLVAPEGKDLLSRAFTARQLDPALARWIPADTSFASLQGFDLAATFDGVRELLPAELRQQLDAFLAQTASREGVDLERDLIRNLGPTFATSGFGDLATALTGASATEVTFAIEIQDGARLRRVIDQALRTSGLSQRIRTRAVGGQLVMRCEPIPVPLGADGRVVTLAPQWWVGDHALLFATSDLAMERALAAGKDEAARGPAALAQALASEGAHLFGLSYDASLGLRGLTLARRTASGLEIASSSGGGTMTAGAALLFSGVLPAIAIPKLLAARIDANERAAMANLRAIAAAQAQFQAEARVDSDGDGLGEYATLAELTGAAPARGGGSGETRPLLTDRLQPDPSGSAERSGYRFRIDLPMALRRGGGPIPQIVAERAEVEFVAYAWPIEPGSSGNRVYALGGDGSLWCSDNRGEKQGYAGLQRMPAADASEERDQADRVVGVTAVRRGRDGGVWLELE
ncbi:MAG: hypothetical protein JNL90_10280 [Planctomycetes bacterium]|nr:hypothetical protein [Planctomycetota bacterium]